MRIIFSTIVVLLCSCQFVFASKSKFNFKDLQNFCLRPWNFGLARTDPIHLKLVYERVDWSRSAMKLKNFKKMPAPYFYKLGATRSHWYITMPQSRRVEVTGEVKGMSFNLFNHKESEPQIIQGLSFIILPSFVKKTVNMKYKAALLYHELKGSVYKDTVEWMASCRELFSITDVSDYVDSKLDFLMQNKGGKKGKPFKVIKRKVKVIQNRLNQRKQVVEKVH